MPAITIDALTKRYGTTLAVDDRGDAASGSLGFADPWDNQGEVVDYREDQFTKTPQVLRLLGIQGLEKPPAAHAEMRAKGLLD